MRPSVLIASALTLAAVQVAGQKAFNFNLTDLPPCPSGSSASPSFQCVGPGYTSNYTTITWPNANSSWAVDTLPVTEFTPTSQFNNSMIYLYNRNVSILPQRVWIVNMGLSSDNLKNGSIWSLDFIYEGRMPAASGYWLVLLGGYSDYTYGTVLATSQEFEIKPKGSKVDYPAAYASFEKETSGADRLTVGVPLVAVLVGAAINVL